MRANNNMYKAPWWCRSGHMQTVMSALYAQTPQVLYRREVVTLNDGDIVAWDWIDPEQQNDSTTPIVLLFHGLEGSSQSHYARRLMYRVSQHGWKGVVAHFRSCGGLENRYPRAYYAGDHQYVFRTVSRLKKLYPQAPIYAVGVSIGGNTLGYALGYYGDSIPITRACIVCSPLDLKATSLYIHSVGSRIFRKYLLSSLNAKMQRKKEQFPRIFPCKKDLAKSFLEFDSWYTAPLHGFQDAWDYWQHCSAKGLLSQVMVPLLVINTRNDPFVPFSCLPKSSEVSSSVVLEYYDEGGHVGFLSEGFPGKNYFLSHRIIRFFVSGG